MEYRSLDTHIYTYLCMCAHSPQNSLINSHRNCSWAFTMCCTYCWGLRISGEHDIKPYDKWDDREVQGAVRLYHRENLKWPLTKTSMSVLCTCLNSPNFHPVYFSPLKKQSPDVAGAVSHLSNVHFSFLLTFRTLTFFRIVMCADSRPFLKLFCS